MGWKKQRDIFSWESFFHRPIPWAPESDSLFPITIIVDMMSHTKVQFSDSNSND